MAEASAWAKQEQLRLAKWCTRYYHYHIAKEIKAGRLPMPRDPEWWQIGWIPQADRTIDRGREGAMMIQMLHNGLATWADLWGAQGHGGRGKVRQRIDEVAWAESYCEQRGVAYERVFPPMAGAPTGETGSDRGPTGSPGNDDERVEKDPDAAFEE
jgi:hypothetical protein